LRWLTGLRDCLNYENMLYWFICPGNSGGLDRRAKQRIETASPQAGVSVTACRLYELITKEDSRRAGKSDGTTATAIAQVRVR
jgi:hypothetical protein